MQVIPKKIPQILPVLYVYFNANKKDSFCWFLGNVFISEATQICN